MRYYIIAGEKSGDLHASNLMKSIKKRDSEAVFRGWGGDAMQKNDLDLVKHYRETAVMGAWEVFKNLFKIFGWLKECKSDILAFQPDVVILVDYGGFNLRIAKFLKENNIKSYYYISPKVWAWNQKRAYKIKRNVDKMFVIMHFEKAFYKKFDFDVDYVGNPLLDAYHDFKPNINFYEENNINKNQNVIAVLPGSRKQEVKNILDKMINISADFPDYQFIIAGVDHLPKELYEVAEGRFKIIYNQTYDLLNIAKSALVTSGTATLETALFRVPQVVCYKTSAITYFLAKLVIKVKYISLVNLVADKEVVKELIQDKFSEKNISNELKNTLSGNTRHRILKGYQDIYDTIYLEEATSERTARLMLDYLKSTK